MLVATKYEEVKPPLISDLLTMCDGAYTREQMIEMEAQVLQVLDYDLSVVTPLDFTEEEGHNEMVLYFLETCLLDHKLAILKPSLQVAAVFRLAQVENQRSFGHSEEDISEVIQRISENIIEQSAGLLKKFGSARYHNIATRL